MLSSAKRLLLLLIVACCLTRSPASEESGSGGDGSPAAPDSDEPPPPGLLGLGNPFGSSSKQRNTEECKTDNADSAWNLGLGPGMGLGIGAGPDRLTFADGFTCAYNEIVLDGFNALVDCYMDYFGFNHVGGFEGCQRSVLDLASIFGFVANKTGCDLINSPNSECTQAVADAKLKEKQQKRASPSGGMGIFGSSAPDSDESGPSALIGPFGFSVAHKAKDGMELTVSSSDDGVSITYTPQFSAGIGFGSSSPDDDDGQSDGAQFPKRSHNSLVVVKKGDLDANFTIEINGYNGDRRLLLILTGKEKLWFRLHCYLCGAWMEMATTCTQRIITYSADKPTMVIPLNNTDGDCSLWKGGSNEETIKREEEHHEEVVKQRRRQQAISVEEETTAAPETTTTATTAEPVPTNPANAFAFDDIIMPIKVMHVETTTYEPAVQAQVNTTAAAQGQANVTAAAVRAQAQVNATAAAAQAQAQVNATATVHVNTTASNSSRGSGSAPVDSASVNTSGGSGTAPVDSAPVDSAPAADSEPVDSAPAKGSAPVDSAPAKTSAPVDSAPVKSSAADAS